MGRAPHAGAPQRVSAHVLPKAVPYDDGNEVDEDEKTTIESGWEEEPSTTVNESEVAEKIAHLRRPQAVTGVTATGIGASEEATVDDREGNMNKMLSMVTPIAQPTRIVITGGNESGVELEIRPGKTYTIGRGVDNDIVLTDIAVSRKHFDLRYEQGQWLIVDRGSGNGTLVNGQLEDQPFALATGDAIEIGNTVFRFEQLQINAPPRPKSPAKPIATMDVDLTGTDDEEEEPSTVAGKPLRPEPEPMPAPPPPMMSRPKTLPPPTPSRSRAASVAPIPQMPPMPMPQLPRPRPVTAMPIAQHEIAPIPSLPSPMTTIPGQGMPHAPSQPQILQSYPGYGYPAANDMPPPYMVHPGHSREAPATAVVAPYGSNPYAAQPAPSLSRRTKMIMGGIGLTAFAAILTAAIVRSGTGPTAVQPEGSTQTATVQQTSPVVKPIEQPTVKPIETPKAPTVTPPPLKVAVTPPPPAPPPTVTVAPKPVAPTPPPPQPKPQVVVAPPPQPVQHHVDPAPQHHVEAPVRHVEEAPPPQPKRVAVAGADGAKSKAAQQFAAKQFPAAIATLKSAAGSAGSDDAKELNQLARIYDQFARNYNVGMAPGTSPTEAYTALTKARNFDQQGAFKSEIEGRLGDVAAKAAASFMGKGQFADAAAAVRLAESVGGGNSTTKSVRSGLESKAADLYNSASKEMPAESAKEKLRTVTKMVDAKSQWYQKATKLLASAG